MIPEEVLADNPAILEKVVELSAKKICRLCLSEVDSLVEIDAVWKMKIVSCFPMVTVGSERLPKYICEPCGKFVKKCCEFRQLCKKSEQMLVNYPLTGSWTGELAIPRWLREEDQQVEAGKKRKFVEDLVVPQVGSVRVRSHESLAMSLQSPTITPGMMEPIDEQSQESLGDSHPTVVRQLEQPTITPTAYQPNCKVPVIQSTSQPVSSQYSPSILAYNTPSIPLRDPVTNITPVSQPPQKIQRTNSIPSLPQLILHPGYTMQQHTPQLVGQSQIQSCNTNLNNMVQMLSQLSSIPQPVVQQQQFTNYTQSNFLIAPPVYQQPLITVAQNHTLSTIQNCQQPFAGTPTIVQNPSMIPNYQQLHPAKTPTRVQNPSVTPNHQQPQIAMIPTRVQNPAMTPTRVQNPSATPTYQQPQIAMTPTSMQTPAMTPTRAQNPSMLQHYLPSQSAITPTIPQNSPTTPTNAQPAPAMTPTRSHQNPTNPSQSIPTAIWCHECNFRFLSVEHYKFHVRKHNPNPIGDLTRNLRPQLKTCRLCTAKIFPTHGDLRRHLEAHERVGLTKACDFCVKIFADEQHRNEHFRKHHAELLELTLKLNGQ